MNKKRRLALLQNLCILCLSLSALFLLLKVFSYESGANGTLSALNDLLTPPAAGSSSIQSTDLAGMSAPFNLIVTGENERYGRMLVNSAVSDAIHSSSLLREALGSASHPTQISEEEFRAALQQTGLFFDYLFPVPSSILSGWFGVEVKAEQSIRYLMISAPVDANAKLYLWDGTGGFFAFDTAVEYAVLQEQLSSFRQEESAVSGEVTLALEAPDVYQHLSPYTVLSGETAETERLSGSVPELASDVDALLAMLDFNPHTMARYNQTNGVEVVEFPRTLRVQHDGVVQYSGDTETASSLYKIPSDSEGPTAAEAVLAVRRLAEILLPEDVLSGTDLYFSGIQTTDAGHFITFDYMINGIPIYFADGSHALEVTTTNNTITYFQVRYRQYAPLEKNYRLLPLQQAIHIASAYENAFLTKGYVDRGGELVTADWLIR